MIRIVSLLLCALLLGGAASAETPFQFATIKVNAPDDPHVEGIRLALLHGDNAVMRGVDFGVFSLSETDQMSGVAFVAGVHKVDGDMDGGVSFSTINLHAGRDRGLNHAFINLLGNPDRAVNIAYLNIARGSTLLDIGGINVSKSSRVQIGFANVTDRLEGFQFGFLNVAENGFLPVFPVFNFPIR